jgi:hypothetical protein
MKGTRIPVKFFFPTLQFYCICTKVTMIMLAQLLSKVGVTKDSCENLEKGYPTI